MNQLETINQRQRKAAIPALRSGDSVRVHQLIKEGSKQRVQVFHGVVIRTARFGEASASLTVRRIASGVGVEKTFLAHSPNVTKIEVVRRAKVRRNFLVYLRDRHGKSARLTELGFDRAAVNVAEPVAAADEQIDAEETELDSDATSDIEPEVEVSTDELSKGEEGVAAQADPESDPDAGDDEAQLPARETEAGLDRADQAS